MAIKHTNKYSKEESSVFVSKLEAKKISKILKKKRNNIPFLKSVINAINKK